LGRTPKKGEEIPANLPEALPSLLLTQPDQTPITATLIHRATLSQIFIPQMNQIEMCGWS
jgi:hypothetical protein